MAICLAIDFSGRPPNNCQHKLSAPTIVNDCNNNNNKECADRQVNSGGVAGRVEGIQRAANSGQAADCGLKARCQIFDKQLSCLIRTSVGQSHKAVINCAHCT